ncbi:hypothetical protein BKA70DRAFT_597974 [Coprinopsis sp. MPI-PUGE-AT-0042]|nr:hypothetical protein BKA70DRAFT_597974 [Coprinopsis sp. MPI-PUGE-AT-0042]
MGLVYPWIASSALESTPDAPMALSDTTSSTVKSARSQYSCEQEYPKYHALKPSSSTRMHAIIRSNIHLALSFPCFFFLLFLQTPRAHYDKPFSRFPTLLGRDRLLFAASVSMTRTFAFFFCTSIVVFIPHVLLLYNTYVALVKLHRAIAAQPLHGPPILVRPAFPHALLSDLSTLQLLMFSLE